MKTIFSVVVLAWSVTVHAQTFVNYKVTAFPNTSPGIYTGTTNVVIPTNVLAKIVTAYSTAAVTGLNVSIVHPGLPAVPADVANGDPIIGSQILGPASVVVNFTSTTGSGQGAVMLVEFTSVNGSASPVGTVIQPANMAATVTLETSTNLATWQPITNAAFGKTNTARFFRTTLTTP